MGRFTAEVAEGRRGRRGAAEVTERAEKRLSFGREETGAFITEGTEGSQRGRGEKRSLRGGSPFQRESDGTTEVVPSGKRRGERLRGK